MRRLAFSVLTMAAVLAACSGEKKGAEPEHQAEAPAAAPAAPDAPDPGRKVVVVNLHTDEKGNYFEPNKLEVHQGDLLRFTVVTGVHNVHFLPDSNPGKSGLPPASEMLQLPGQTYDLKVTLPHGKYYFQCDPHAALGMQGHLEVED